jgi:hypothetical protein
MTSYTEINFLLNNTFAPNAAVIKLWISYTLRNRSFGEQMMMVNDLMQPPIIIWYVSISIYREHAVA